MKAKMFLLLSLCLGLAACNESQEVKNTPYMPYEWGNGEVYVLQFKKPEYKEYIMAYHPPYDNTCLIPARKCGCSPVFMTNKEAHCMLLSNIFLATALHHKVCEHQNIISRRQRNIHPKMFFRLQ